MAILRFLGCVRRALLAEMPASGLSGACRRLSPRALILVAALAALQPECFTAVRPHRDGQLPRAPRAAQGSPPASQDRQYEYFFDLEGNFEKIDPIAAVEAGHGQIASAHKLTTRSSGFDGCIVCAVRGAPRLHRVFAVVANSARMSDENRSYRIVALDTSSMEEIGPPAAQPVLPCSPSILITPDDKQLLASCDMSSASGDQAGVDLSVFNLPEIKLEQKLHAPASTDGPARLWFSTQAYWGPDAKIYDQFDVIFRAGGDFTKTSLDPHELLASVSEGPLLRYRLPAPPGGKPYYAVDYADSAGGQILVVLNAGKTATQGALLIDARTRGLSVPIPVNQVTVHTAHLTPDAGQVLVDEIEWEKNSGDASREIKWTGKFSLFDARNGKKTGSILSSQLAGTGVSFLGMSSGGRAAFYARGGRLYVLNLQTGKTTKVAINPGAFIFDQWTTLARDSGTEGRN